MSETEEIYKVLDSRKIFAEYEDFTATIRMAVIFGEQGVELVSRNDGGEIIKRVSIPDAKIVRNMGKDEIVAVVIDGVLVEGVADLMNMGGIEIEARFKFVRDDE